MDPTDLIALTSDIVSAHVSNNSMDSAEIPGLIGSVYAALAKTIKPVESETEKAEPAVPVRSSVKQDYLVCLEDGKKLKMLKRYLRTNYNMTPEEYRAKWNLPRDYPMVAPAYAETRRTLAKNIGLGRKKVLAADDALIAPKPAAAVVKRPVGRPAKPKPQDAPVSKARSAPKAAKSKAVAPAKS